MSEELFTNPATSTGIEFTDHLGHLLLVSPHALEVGIKTQFGDNDAIRADVTDLDLVDPATGLPSVYADVLIFPRVLISQLRPRIGGRVLGRLGQNPAKAGQSAAWALVDFTPEDAARASSYITHMASISFAAPAQDAWAATPAPAAPPAQAPAAPAAAPATQGWGTGTPPF